MWASGATLLPISRTTPARAAAGRRRDTRRPGARVVAPSRSAIRRRSAEAAGRCPRTQSRARRARSRPRAAFRRRCDRARLSSRASPLRRGSPRWRSLVPNGWRFPPRDHDVREELVLRQVDDGAAVQIEERDERDDGEADRRRAAEERSEAHPPLRRDQLLDLEGALLDRVALPGGDDVLLTLLRRERQHSPKCEGEGIDLAAPRRQLDRAALAVERALAGAETRTELARALAHDRVFEQPCAQLLLRFSVLQRERLERRQQAPCLQQNEPRGEGEESRDLVRGQRRHRADTREICVGQIAEPHREDVELLLLDELDEQIERPVEALDRDAGRLRLHHGKASRSARARSRSSSVIGRW